MWIDGSLAQEAAPASVPQLHAGTVFGPINKPARRRAALIVKFPARSSSSSRPSPVRKVLTADILPTASNAPVTSTYLEKLLNDTPMQENHRRIARQVLSLMAPECQEKLQTFSVLYDNPKQRGLAGKGVVIVSGNVPDHEFIGLLMHEALGHFREITCVTGTSKSGASPFRDGDQAVWNNDPSVRFYAISWANEHERKADAKKDDFVTGYAYVADPFEDAAESITYYMTQESAFRERAKTNTALAAKLAWIETYLPKHQSVATGQTWDGTIAWDSTKLEFAWNAEAN
jgi:hypothetical protein